MTPAPSPPAILPTLADQIFADPIPNPSLKNATDNKDQHFLSRCFACRMGQVAPIAFGGNIIALAVHAAHQTLPSNSPKPYHAYSILGTFHSGSKVDRKVHITVTPTRDTRTFATRRAVAFQPQDDGTTRTCIELTVDFHIEEPTFLKWDAQPDLPEVLTAGPLHPTRTRSGPDILAEFLSKGHVTEKQAQAFRAMYREAEHHIELRHAYPSVSGANLMGTAPRLPTPQDHLPIPQRTTYEWIRIRPQYSSPEDSPFSYSTSSKSKPSEAETEYLNMTALSFAMDQALSFLPLNHDHKGFDDSSACSTLDFALRIFVPRVEMEQWHLRERKTVSAGVGRTFSEARLWSEKGVLVCTMSQACILRAAIPKDKAKGRKELESKM